MSETMRATDERGAEEQTGRFVDDATVRERVWDATLILLSERPLPFQAWRVRKRSGLTNAQDRTIRRALTMMAKAGWLEHNENSKWWHPGPKAKDRLR